MKYNRKELLSVPKRKWNETLENVVGVMDFVAEFEDPEKPLVRFGGGCDDVCLDGKYFKIDCIYPSRILHIWSYRKFSVSHDLSSIFFREENT